MFLTVRTKLGYIVEFEITADHRAGNIVRNPRGKLNMCEVSSRVWFHCPDNLSWPHGPWRSKMKTHRRENSGILFLG
ncbi:hypothetical protein GH733_016269, partial [Mirounga leonina]